MDKTATVYLLLGSNEGNRTSNLFSARQYINTSCGNIICKSKIYETEAWGVKQQAGFLNQAIAVETHLAADNLLDALKQIEKKIGRREAIRWGPRIIDIDILFYNDLVLNKKNLILPHPYLHLRRFTLVPLFELNPHLIHPVLKVSVTQLLSDCPDESDVKVYKD